MIDRLALVRDLKTQVRELEEDLRARAADEFDQALRAEWQSARDAERTAVPYESGLKNSWLDDRVTQAAVAWVLGTVFGRFCEDNGLLQNPYLAGRIAKEHGSRLDVAKELQEEYWNTADDPTDRGWIERSFDALAVTKATAGLFDRAHNPMWTITPSHEAAKRLLAFWRETDETGEIRHDFTDHTWNTRFLGDLYEDLSQHAKDTYALRQTPQFVEKFILDYTLDPALEEFADDFLDGKFRLIDPTCGSGHFLLGSFHRLLREWERLAPGTDRWELIARTLNSVHGVDKNPYAAAIARFRLLLVAMQAGDIHRLADLRADFVINVAVGDSLLHGEGGPVVADEIPGVSPHSEIFTYRTEDISDYVKSCNILKVSSYHVVVGNPPYITVKDRQENRNYRLAYIDVCSGKYALSVPFAARFFQLARRAGGSDRNAGYVGQITSNSFMKREFGKKIIENYFSGADERRSPQLTHVIDTSAAYIPGHGTPTVILIGRNQIQLSKDTVRAVMSIQGEASQPENAEDGKVWQAIRAQIDHPGSESQWISVSDLPRVRLLTHPWSLSGGGAANLLKKLTLQTKLRSIIDGGIGPYAITGDDEVYVADNHRPATWNRYGAKVRPFVTGDDVRDWTHAERSVIWPYDGSDGPDIAIQKSPLFWPYRSRLRAGLIFGETREEREMEWNEYAMLNQRRIHAAHLIAFACVSTHGHFCMASDSTVLNRHAPVIKLREQASVDDHLALLGVLNSSTACFWLKQVSHDKGSQSGTGGFMHDEWERFYEFTGTKLQEFPLPSLLPLKIAQELNALSQQLTAAEPDAVCAVGVPSREQLEAVRARRERIRNRMIGLQEELDWEVYRIYELLDGVEAAELIAPVEAVPELQLGERAFEIVLARKVARGAAKTVWFSRHGSTPITEIPLHWPETYRKVVENRIETIERRRDLGLIERPECKRRWASESWEKREREALRRWLLERCEEPSLWFTPDGTGGEQAKPMTVFRLADRLSKGPDGSDVVAVARLYGGDDAKLADVIEEIIEIEHVPFLAPLRYKESGLIKRGRWEQTWGLQREEDRTGQRLDIDVPDKYSSGDFVKVSYWRNRGKLDVPKERFISYPLASPDTDGSLLLGWAGWNHLEQAQALYTLLEERRFGDGWDRDRLAPLVAGLAEVMPWVWQWYGERDAEGRIPAAGYAEYLEEQQRELKLTDEELAAWRPKKVAGRSRSARN
ncbi:BREX-2 system adenine-specific DNA-methyltransferase PglX [Streptosporangium canum]|uniref:BREX-2 system adenine-specific DNA-methyltransferase PglX n=1 Tax=Streptosporangium canum TaxID=324952 RepID=UPI0037B447C3